MRFRPCIDIHNGKVKQIVGSSLRDAGDAATENYVAEQGSAEFACRYKEDRLTGGHIILLNGADSQYYEVTKAQALEALRAYPGGLQVGGGIRADNAKAFIEAGASHVIVTSYVFRDGRIDYDNLKKLVDAVGKEHVVLDLSCRFLKKATSLREEDGYYIVTDRWQVETRERITQELLDGLAQYCDEFLVHAVDVEGKQNGIESSLVALLGEWGRIPVTYAGGVRNLGDLDEIYEKGKNRIDVTIGSSLDMFGGPLPYKEVIDYVNRLNGDGKREE